MASSGEYIDFAEKLYESCIISDAWIDGKERFALEPVLLSKSQYEELTEAAERIGFAYEELCRIVWDKPELVDYFNLTPYQKALWFSSGGLWHGISRLDLFILENGSVKMCEMNSDTPSGEAETALLNEYFADKYPEFANPNENFGKAFVSMFRSFEKQLGVENTQRTVGIVYPTEMTEDLSMIKLYESWLGKAGYGTITGSPFNLSYKDNGLYLLNRKIDLLLRHYKTDWWTERISPWNDFEYPDRQPLREEIKAVLQAYSENKVNIINPFGSVITQNKFSMSFFFDLFELFSDESKQTIIDYIPETRRAVSLELESLDKSEWVLKSDYGCEGEEVLIGKNMKDELWSESLSKMNREHWIAQRFFNIKKYADKFYPNYGVYLIAGKASGIFTRLDELATDYHSITAPTFIEI